MGNTHVKAVEDVINPDAVTFASLPVPLEHRIFLALPPDARGRSSCVCRAWRKILRDPSLWTRLDMSSVRVQLFYAVLRGAALRAGNKLLELDLSQQHVKRDRTLPLLNPYAGTLRELRVHTLVHSLDNNDSPTVEAVVAAAPLLQVLTAERMACTWKDAPRVLRAEPPFALLQLGGSLAVQFDNHAGDVGGMERSSPFGDALADASLQPALKALSFFDADAAQPALMDTLVDAALARRLRELALHNGTHPAAAPLARLLAGGALSVLKIGPFSAAVGHMPLFDVDGAALVADALRVNTMLTKLHLFGARLCLVDVRVAEVLLAALVGHPSLRELQIIDRETMAHDRDAFGAALAALISADAPTLHVLVCCDNSLGDAGLAPIVKALPLNHHLREINLRNNFMSEVACGGKALGPDGALEAEELVRLRGQHN